MKILAFSDLHRDAAKAEAIVNESRGADVVVGAGDFASCGMGHGDTLNVLRRMAVPFVLVPGNHDDLGELFAACADWPAKSASVIGPLMFLSDASPVAMRPSIFSVKIDSPHVLRAPSTSASPRP